MRKLLRNLCAFVGILSLTLPSPVLATSRVNWYAQQNPISTWLNLSQRDTRVGEGAFAWNAFGSNAGFAGTFANLTITPAGSLNISVNPTNTSFPGTLYAIASDDVAAYPATQPSGATGLSLTADSTQLLIEGITTVATSAVGTTAGTTSGQSVNNLVECKPATTDQTTQTINLITSSGGSAGTASVNRDRADLVSCQVKPSASSTSPTIPSVDANYVALGYVNVPYGTSTVTTGMVTQYPGFQGFALASTPGATAIDTSSSGQTKTGALAVNGNLSWGNNTSGGTLYPDGHITNTSSITSQGTVTNANAGTVGFQTTTNDGNPALLYPSNNGGNQASIGVNTGAGYPYFSIAKLGTNGSFQNWLLGVDATQSLIVPNGSVSTPYNVNFGGSGVGGTLYGSNGNIQHTGNLVTGGSATIGGTASFAATTSTTGEIWEFDNGSTLHQYLDSSDNLRWYDGTHGHDSNAALNLNTGSLTLGGGLTVPASVAVGGGLTTNGFINNAPATINGTLYAQGITDNGSFSSNQNISWGGSSIGGTLYGSTGNINASGSLSMSGNAFFGGPVTATGGLTVNGGTTTITGIGAGAVESNSSGQLFSVAPGAVGSILASNGTAYANSTNVNVPGSVTAGNGYLSTSTGPGSGKIYFGTAGVATFDYGNTLGGAYTLNQMTTAGVVVNNSSGTLSSIAPGSAGNQLISTGSGWASATFSHSTSGSCGTSTGSGSNCGYTVLPGGVIIEWGITDSYASEGAKTLTLPLAFPNRMLSMSSTLYTNTPANNIDQYCQVYPISNSQIGSYMQQGGGGNYTYPEFCSWTAIGF